MEVLREHPNAASFIPLVEHQSTTPSSFYTGPPVLHYHSDRSKVIIIQQELDKAPAFIPISHQAQPIQSSTSNTQTNGDSDSHQTQKVIENVDIYVTSDKLLLFSESASTGVAIPYPTISLHAVQTLPAPSSDTTPAVEQGVNMQLITSTESDEEIESISVTLIPTAVASPATAAGAGEVVDPVENEDQPEQTPVQALFNALSNCSNLHPDPDDEEDGDGGDGVSRLIQSGLVMPTATSDGGLPPPMPGSGGWITAENMHEFVDEDGNFIEQDEDEEDGDEDEDATGREDAPLGPGAGTVRTRDNDAGDEDDAKWQRTS